MKRVANSIALSLVLGLAPAFCQPSQGASSPQWSGASLVPMTCDISSEADTGGNQAFWTTVNGRLVVELSETDQADPADQALCYFNRVSGPLQSVGVTVKGASAGHGPDVIVSYSTDSGTVITLTPLCAGTVTNETDDGFATYTLTKSQLGVPYGVNVKAVGVVLLNPNTVYINTCSVNGLTIPKNVYPTVPSCPFGNAFGNP